jgi:hypothetical protein
MEIGWCEIGLLRRPAGLKVKGLKMNSQAIVTIALSLCLLPTIQIHANSDDKVVAQEKIGAPSILVTKLDINDKSLKLSYEIRNDSEQDIWILTGLDKFGTFVRAFIDQDDRTLLLRRWFGTLSRFHGNALYGRYVRLRVGQTRTESVFLSFPMILSFPTRKEPRERGLATRMIIEIGYYTGDLTGKIRASLGKSEKNSKEISNEDLRIIQRWYGSLLIFNEINEVLRDRDEEIIIPYYNKPHQDEQVMRLKIDDLNIPYTEKRNSIESYTPDLSNCIKVEIQYKPSMLEYFFPYENQQLLLSGDEMRYLQSPHTVVVDDPEDLKVLIDDVSKDKESYDVTELFHEGIMAHVTCYSKNEHLMSFNIYDDRHIETEEKELFRYHGELKCLRPITPQIKPYESRILCAANLRDIWYRLRLYQEAAKELRIGLFRRREKKPYPASKKWCDYMTQAYRIVEMRDTNVKRLLRCPGVGEGECHYAMNPHCKPDSPADMVLLFETKAGWNQHGGPELFTFENHEPKGGCVLLNDGTVKFIRTEEELQQLRWK